MATAAMVSEAEAQGKVKAIYDDIKQSLGIDEVITMFRQNEGTLDRALRIR